MKHSILFAAIFTMFFCSISSGKTLLKKDTLTFFKADNPLIQYTGRIDFANPSRPRFWSPGVYITAKFKGTFCEVTINDEFLYQSSYNYIEIAIDKKKPFRIRTNGRVNVFKVAEGLPDGEHVITICKNTESNIGYLEFVGIRCMGLLPLPAKPSRKIECIGNSITCGTGSDTSVVPCDKGKWHDQHNAYFSYGPSTARALNAQWQLTAVSGIGLMQSCCGLKYQMPRIFDKVNLREDSLKWDFNRYQPDLVTICLGQNDGKQDSTIYCGMFVDFIKQIRSNYPKANIICINSPMGDDELTKVLKNYLTGVVTYMNKNGDNKVNTYFFSKRYFNGCGTHPSMQEHQQIAGELTAFIKKLMNW